MSRGATHHGVCGSGRQHTDPIKIIDLRPNNKIRVQVPRNFAWLPDGPIQQYFQHQVQNDFFRSRFGESGELMMFTSGMLSRAGNASMQSRMKRLSAEFTELHRVLRLNKARRWKRPSAIA